MSFRKLLCTCRLSWASRNSQELWDETDDTALQTKDSKFDLWQSEVEHSTSQSRRLPTVHYTRAFAHIRIGALWKLGISVTFNCEFEPRRGEWWYRVSELLECLGRTIILYVNIKMRIKHCHSLKSRPLFPCLRRYNSLCFCLIQYINNI